MTEATVRPSLEARTSSDGNGNSPQIAHTLTACVRCRSRKTRCDPGLPRCGPCERTSSHCEYFDQAKGIKVPRYYVVRLQDKVRDLENILAQLETEDGEPDTEDVLRSAAAVRFADHDESKYLGPSSGIAITRLVMQLAKKCSESTSITDIVSERRAKSIKNLFQDEEEQEKSRIYPLISDVAAIGLPERHLTDTLAQVFLLKVIAMYPFLHEPTLLKDIDEVYDGSTDPYQNFEVRMVIAVGLQRMETQYAGLADSFYLAALKYLEGTIKPMNIKTIQCFCFFAVYSLLTPTRTAVYYVIGLAGRLVQALGLCEEKTITQGANGSRANELEIDMRRRVYWCAMVMEFGLAHSLGRPSCFPMALEHMDVGFYHHVDDEYITEKGVVPNATLSLKKWISIHFFRMRLLQLEIRRTLYQKKRPEPKNDNDPWFKQMEEKLIKWRDSSPEGDAGSGLNSKWFVGRLNTMRVFLFRPSPQVPRPSLRAARECYDACEYNIYMHRDQIASRSVELTWIFTQSIFMAINTILWTLSYEEIRQEHPRDEVMKHLKVALSCIGVASERWPGVASARELYHYLIEACFRVYDRKGDLPITASSPSESSPSADAASHRSTTTSPILPHKSLTRELSTSAQTPPLADTHPFEYLSAPQQFYPSPSHHGSIELEISTPGSFAASLQTPPQPTIDSLSSPPNSQPPAAASNDATPLDESQEQQRTHEKSFGNISNFSFESAFESSFDPNSQFNPLPSHFDPASVHWNPTFDFRHHASSPISTTAAVTDTFPSLFDPNVNNLDLFISPLQNAPIRYTDYLYPPSWNLGTNASSLPNNHTGLHSQPGHQQSQFGIGLSQAQQMELMRELEMGSGKSELDLMIQTQNALFYPQGRG